MQSNMKQTFKYIAVLIGLLIVVNIGIRVYDDVTADCPVERDRVVFAGGANSNSHGGADLVTSSALHSSTLCCPKVYLYDPRAILKKAQALYDKPLHLHHLDPLNVVDTFAHIPYQGNVSIPEAKRVEVLTQLLRWMPQEDEVNQSLIIPPANVIPDNHSIPDSPSSSKIWYSKDFVNLFSMRIALSQCVTSDPREADLFLVPMSVHTDHNHGRKSPLSGEWDTFFGSLTNYQAIFEHFTDKTAAKHVIFSSSFGHSRRSIGLWHPPFGDPRVSQMQRVALGSKCLIAQNYKPFHYFVKSPLHVHSTPFSSLLAYPEDYFDSEDKDKKAKTPPQHNTPAAARPPPQSWINSTASTVTVTVTAPPEEPHTSHSQKLLLVSAFFGFHGGDKVRDLRKKLIHICEHSHNCSTKAMKSKTTKTDRKTGMLALFETKKASTFCLEPEGDWPTRQSMIQDIMLNCIPVFFSPNHLRLWPAFWGNFIDHVSITFDYAAVMEDRVDIMQRLEGISPEVIRRKQEIMKSHKHQLNFLHVNDYIEHGNNFEHSCAVDAANLLLHDLHQGSRHTA